LPGLDWVPISLPSRATCNPTVSRLTTTATGSRTRSLPGPARVRVERAPSIASLEGGWTARPGRNPARGRGRTLARPVTLPRSFAGTIPACPRTSRIPARGYHVVWAGFVSREPVCRTRASGLLARTASGASGTGSLSRTHVPTCTATRERFASKVNAWRRTSTTVTHRLIRPWCSNRGYTADRPHNRSRAYRPLLPFPGHGHDCITA